MRLGLEGKVALVTGARRGIGRGIADVLAAEGAVLAVNDLDLAEAKAAAEAIAAQGGRAEPFAADVGDADSVEAMVSKVVERLGRIDILVNNAGVATRTAVLETSAKDWERVIRTNLQGCFHCCQTVGRHMMSRGGGAIVNITSIHGKLAKAAMGSYCTTKAALDMLTKQLAVELAPHGIRVNAVAPGTIETEINFPLYKSTSPEHRPLQQATLKRIPMARWGQPHDIGSAVAFLASDAAAGYITGVVLYVDGGYTAEGTPRI